MRLLLSLAFLLGGCSTVEQLVATTTNAGTDWSSSATDYRDRPGQRVAYVCPPNPSRTAVGPVWGADVYTDDSAVCAAAVHAGKITFQRGGRVTIETRPGQGQYRGTNWNGVESADYGAWDGSFVFVGS